MRVAYIKLRKHRNLGRLKRITIVEKYYNREDAEKCTLKGIVYPAPAAYGIMKDFNSKQNGKNEK